MDWDEFDDEGHDFDFTDFTDDDEDHDLDFADEDETYERRAAAAVQAARAAALITGRHKVRAKTMFRPTLHTAEEEAAPTPTWPR